MSDPTRPIPKTGAKRAPGALPEKAVARRPGHARETPGNPGEEEVAEVEARRRLEIQQQDPIRTANQKINEAKKARPGQSEDSEPGAKERRDPRAGRVEREPIRESTKAGVLAHNAAFAKSAADSARDRGFQNTPGLAEIIAGKNAAKTGESLGALLPGARARPRPDLPEPDMRPPVFLSPLESMADIYMRTRGRMTAKTKELLESPALEDLLSTLAKLHEDEALVRSGEARLRHEIWSRLKDDPGPLLLGLGDPRLTEPWRLFLDRWDIWVPDGKDGEGGVELFWEGEAEDDDGAAIEILQSLSYARGEVTFHAKMGPHEDRITFDGQAFYRLETELGSKPKR